MLGRFVPDFGRIVAMMQFNMYHHYTVDEHLIRSIGVLADIDAGRARQRSPAFATRSSTPSATAARSTWRCSCTTSPRDVPRITRIAGAAIARKLGPRFGLDAAETDTAAWLVEHHLLMSKTAQSRDLSDPATIESFAGWCRPWSG